MEKKTALLICSQTAGSLSFSACSSAFSSSSAIAAQVSEALENALEETALAEGLYAAQTSYPSDILMSVYQQEISDRYYNNYAIPPTCKSRPGGMSPEDSHGDPQPPMLRD